MTDANLKVTVTANVRIMKYDVGVTPETGDPFEVEEKKVVLTGEEAQRAINQLGADNNGTN